MSQKVSLRFMVAESKIGMDGRAPLQMSIIVDKKRVYVQLPKKLFPSEFNNKTQESTLSDVNNYIHIVRTRIMEIQTDFYAIKSSLTAQKVKDVFNGMQLRKVWCLLEFYENYVVKLTDLLNVTVNRNTLDKHKYLLGYLRHYMQNHDKPIEDTKPSFINEFYFFLRKNVQQHNITLPLVI